MDGRRVVRRAIAVLGLATVAVFAVLPSAGATPPGPEAHPALVKHDLSSVSAMKSYLRLLGIDPASVVIQRGARNYAGPNCPGAAWNCTTSQRVVQVSAAGDNDDGENRFVCRRDRGSGSVTKDDSLPDQSCVIVQPGGTRNTATCDIRTTGTTGTISQACFITQGGTQNSAVARLVAVMGSHGSEQDVLQRIEIKQTGGASGNSLEASEIALLGAAADKADADVETKQDFHQVVCGNQQATGGGRNSATVSQHGAAAVYYTNAGAVDVEQNREFLPSLCTANPPGAAPFVPFPEAVPPHDQFGCAVASDSFGFPKEDANTCSRIQQQSGSGRNTIDRQSQSNALIASVKDAASVSIGQGTFSGGIDSTQDQKSSGVSRIVDSQRSDQLTSISEISGFIDIAQIEDPRCCAAGHQLGNSGNTWTLGQGLTQRALVDGVLVDPDLFSGLIVQRGADYGNCTSTGNCTVNQKVSNNVVSETNSCSAPSCDIFTECSAGSFGDFRSASPAVIQQVGACATEDDISAFQRAGRR